MDTSDVAGTAATPGEPGADPDRETDVVVVGAGLAGLACAQDLEGAGLTVRVVEREHRVGGRTGGRVVDGYRCDLGLSWVDTADPVLRGVLDVAALNPRPIDRGVVLAHPDGYRVLQGSQAALLRTVRGGLGQPDEIARLIRWSDPLRRPPERITVGPDTTLGESLDRHGVGGRLREEVLEPIFRLLFADTDLRTSYQWVMTSLLRLRDGVPALPALGMQALPDQMALSLSGRVELGVAVEQVHRDTGGGVGLTTTAGPVRARAVVVATDPATASGLLGLGVPAMRGISTWWFAADAPPTTLKTIFLDPVGRPSGPLSHALVVSNVAPRYAPAGRALVGGVTLPVTAGEPDPATETEVRRHLGRLFHADGSWQLVEHQAHAAAWPIARPPLLTGREVDLGDGVFVAGDHRGVPGFSGAIASGLRAAQAVRRQLEEPARRP